MSVDTGGVCLNDSASARTINHQVVTGWALSLGNGTFCGIMSFCITATIWAANFLCYLHFTTFFSLNKKNDKKSKKFTVARQNFRQQTSLNYLITTEVNYF
jgi:hypothetical protein